MRSFVPSRGQEAETGRAQQGQRGSETAIQGDSVAEPLPAASSTRLSSRVPRSSVSPLRVKVAASERTAVLLRHVDSLVAYEV